MSNHEVVRLEKNSSEFFELQNLGENRHEKNRKVNELSNHEVVRQEKILKESSK